MSSSPAQTTKLLPLDAAHLSDPEVTRHLGTRLRVDVEQIIEPAQNINRLKGDTRAIRVLYTEHSSRIAAARSLADLVVIIEPSLDVHLAVQGDPFGDTPDYAHITLIRSVGEEEVRIERSLTPQGVDAMVKGIETYRVIHRMTGQPMQANALDHLGTFAQNLRDTIEVPTRDDLQELSRTVDSLEHEAGRGDGY